jgi:hypothetical protein
MTQQLIGVGSAADDGTGDPARTAFVKANANFTELYSLQSQTINAGAAAYTAASREASIQLAINAAVAAGALRVFVPSSMLPYNAALVTFNAGVQMVAEGADFSQYDARAYGAAGNGSTDDTAALQALKVLAQAGQLVTFRRGTYLTSLPLSFTNPVKITGEIGARIKLTAAASYVMGIDGTSGVSGWMYGPEVENLILDGNGFCADGLYLTKVINGSFPNIRTTNVTVAGFHLAWAQLCVFINPTCSGHVEAFTTTPANGLLVDSTVRSSSANTFINPTFEVLSGSGIKGISLINSTFEGGTSELNNVGIELGEAVDVGNVAHGNVFKGMDLEANTLGDVICRTTAWRNSFIGLASGTGSPAVSMLGAKYNTFVGGCIGGITLDVNSAYNRLDDVKLLGSGRTISDTGLGNSWRGVFNISDAVMITEIPTRRRGNAVGATATWDCSLTAYGVVTATGATLTINAPTNPADSVELDITVHNASGGALTTTWNAIFHFTGWVDPANTKTRSVRFRYDANYVGWYMMSMSAVDQPA